MQFLKFAFVSIPDQIMSTFILWAGGFVIYRGIVSIATHPPSKLTVGVVICIGIVLGLIDARRSATMPHEKNNNVHQVDK